MTTLSLRRLRRFKENKKAFASLILLGTLFTLSLFSEWICNDRPLIFDAPIPFHYSTIDLEIGKSLPSAPDLRHLLGTDDRGRDIFARLIYGFRLSLIFALLAAGISAFLGMCFGSLQAYEGSHVDSLGQRVSEIVNSLPELLLLMLLTSIFQPSFILLLVFMTMTGWMNFASYTRSECLRIKQLDYLKSAQMIGASPFRILSHHMLPNAISPIVSYFPIRVGYIVTNLAALDFLGLGLPSPNPSLGELLVQGKNHLQCWWILIPGICTLSLILILLNFISEGLRHAFDPKG